MTITLELEELKADYLEDLNRYIKKTKDNQEAIKIKIESSYDQFFFDFMDDFPFNDFCIWILANTNIEIEMA